MEAEKVFQLWTRLHKKNADENEIQKLVDDFITATHASATKVMVFTKAEIDAGDVYRLHLFGVEALLQGRYRDAFYYLHSCLHHFSSNYPVWIRISEAIVYEHFEDELQYDEIYKKVFGSVRKSPRKAMNETRERPELMTMEYAYQTSMVALMLARCGRSEEHIHRASIMHMYVIIKTGRYSLIPTVIRNGLPTNNTVASNSAEKAPVVPEDSPEFDEMSQPLIPVTEEIRKMCNQAYRFHQQEAEVLSKRSCRNGEPLFFDVGTSFRLVGFLDVVTYLHDAHYMKAIKKIQEVLKEEKLNRQTQEAMCIFGIHIAYKIENDELLKKFVAVLKKIAT